jgi:putative N6-adenine-specific DNA methylase
LINITTSLLKRVRSFITITGYDKAPSAVQKAKDNIKNANLDRYIKMKKETFDTEKQPEGSSHMVSTAMMSV